MTKEKRMECLSWLVEQAEAIQNGITGIEFGDGISVNRVSSDLELHIFGSGFYELARAASQVVHTVELGSRSLKEYFLFDGVQFFRLTDRPEESEASDD